LSPPQCAAVPASVAVNADPRLRETASLTYEGRDLREAYGLVHSGS
jgi:phosphoserine phosphatase